MIDFSVRKFKKLVWLLFYTNLIFHINGKRTFAFFLLPNFQVIKELFLRQFKNVFVFGKQFFYFKFVKKDFYKIHLRGANPSEARRRLVSSTESSSLPPPPPPPDFEPDFRSLSPRWSRRSRSRSRERERDLRRCEREPRSLDLDRDLERRRVLSRDLERDRFERSLRSMKYNITIGF